MKTRILTSLVAVAVFVPFCIWSGEPKAVFLIFAAVISLIAAYEILKCTGLDKNLPSSLICYLSAVSAPILTRVFSSAQDYFIVASFIYFALIFLSFVNATFSKGKIAVVDSALAAIMTVYVTFSMSSIVLMRDMTVFGNESVNLGGKIYLLAFLFAWIPDIGGYFFGRFFGKHKLIPDVSPKKTVEGFVGGIFSAVVVSVIYGFIIGLSPKGDIKGFLLLAVLAVICSLVSVCGDLLASLVKRHYGIKDYGFIFPGHGGVLDRFDSVIAVAPFLYIASYIANSFSLFSDFITL